MVIIEDDDFETVLTNRMPIFSGRQRPLLPTLTDANAICKYKQNRGFECNTQARSIAAIFVDCFTLMRLNSNFAFGFDIAK